MILTPYLVVKGAAAALDFYTRAFGAEEQLRLTDPAGPIGHAHMAIGDSAFMLADEPERGSAPRKIYTVLILQAAAASGRSK